MTDIKFNSNEKSEPSIANNEGTQRKLEARHITMIAGIFFITKVGGTIGTGLLVSTGGTLAEAGAMGALIAYLIAGLAIYFVVNSLGEMATLIPITGSFNAYAARFVDPALGFACGWIYWFGWVTTFPLELIACGGFLKFWLPGVDKYLLMSLVLVSLVILNCFAVKGFGEMEYWLSLIKIIAILFFLVTIIYVLVRNNAGLSAYEEAGGAFLGRSAGPAIMKTVNAMIGASFAFAGTELVGITAGEAANPRVSIPRAVNGTFYRIIFFYISCIFLIGLLLPANLPAFTEKDDLVRSPFVVALASAGISGVDHIMNFVCFIAVYSAANSTVYASARCLMALAQEGQAPRFLARTHNGVPFAAMLISVLFGCIAFCGSLIGDGLIFDWLVNMTGLGLIVTWMMINITHILFRRAYLAQGYLLKDLPYQAVFYPYGCYFAIFVTGSVIVLSPVFTIMTSLEDPEMTSLGIFTNFMGTFISIPLFVGLFLFWKYYKKTKFVTPKSADLFTSNINLSKIDGIYYGEGTGEEELKGWKKLIAFLA